ncbi:DUF998 domain-containing protein [Shewanella dokdonensis]|uniref:DUF998 domain-containing protein n=1 Tax=Shewanella dokdonensis TaxID=712036 RepID=UPI00200E3F19|nr:DUF998 domain-containing protein [Shewanella dokdonensis]MCL1073606.1 DUF998 domain-containing protein [Shewanella dokdonensis]
MEKKQRLIKLALGFGVIGLLGLLLGLIISIIGYDALGDEHFNLTNYTMSELGNYGHSPFAVALNGGLFFGSLCLVLFSLYSLQLSRSLTGAISFFSLALSCMSLAGIGLFPVNVYHLHVFMLKWFFIFSCISALVYLVNQTLTQPPSGMRWSCLPALLSCISFAMFLFLPLFELDVTEGNRPFYHEMVLEGTRPALWWPALLQWISLGCFLLWLAVLLYERFRSRE